MREVWRAKIWQRRFLFLTLNGLATCIVYLLVVLPVRHMLSDREVEISDRSEVLARWHAIAAREADLKQRTARSTAKRGEFWVTNNENVALADLQTRLKGLVEGAGARVRSVQGTPTATRDGVTYIGARLELFGPLAAVQRAVHAIETNRPFLFVTAALLKTAQPQSTPSTAAEPVIEAQLEISAPLEFRGA